MFTYHEALQRAACLNGWRSTTLIAQNASPECITKSTLAILPSLELKARNKAAYLQEHAAAILEVQKRFEEDEQIYFYESFYQEEPWGFVLSLFAMKKKPQVCFLHRCNFDIEKMKCGVAPKVLHDAIEKVIGSNRLYLMTDTSLLKAHHEHHFQRNVTLLPIPHTNLSFMRGRVREQLRLWWPGNARIEKGIEHICRFARHRSDKVRLMVTEVLKPLLKEAQISIDWMTNILSQEEYHETMSQVEVVLLPYLASTYYAASSSGIFVEAVVAGCLPISSDETWIASELKEAGLSELIVDWQKEDLGDQIWHLFHNEEVRKKLSHLQEKYAAFHTVDSFARILKQALYHI